MHRSLFEEYWRSLMPEENCFNLLPLKPDIISEKKIYKYNACINYAKFNNLHGIF